MNGSRRRSLAFAGCALIALLVGAFAYWRLEVRTRADSVGPRFTEALLQHRPGTTVDAWNGVAMRIALTSGLYVDVRLRTLFENCRAHRFGCASALADALDDVDRIDAATRAPQVSMLRPIVVKESLTGASLGYVAEPVVGGFELRYALVDGIASTFVTAAVADRLALSHAALKDAAFANQHAEAPPSLEAVETDGAVRRVRSAGDPAALLFDRVRMKALAAQLQATRLYAVIPANGTLHLARADDAGAKALSRVDGGSGIDLLVYEVDAPDGQAMSLATSRP